MTKTQKKTITELFSITMGKLRQKYIIHYNPEKLKKRIDVQGILSYEDKFCVFTEVWVLVIPEDIPEIVGCVSTDDACKIAKHHIEKARSSCLQEAIIISQNEIEDTQRDFEANEQHQISNSGVWVNPKYWRKIITVFPKARYYCPVDPRKPIYFEDDKTKAYGILCPVLHSDYYDSKLD